MTFLPSLDNQFVYDDLPIITMNPTVTHPGAWYRFWREPYWPRGSSPDKLYRPLTIWSYRANVVLSGQALPDPWWFHVVNLGLHALASAGVAVLAWRLTGRASAAWIGGALFAAHPLHTESVVTGYGRAELLAGVLGVWLLVRHARPCGIQRRSPLFHTISALMFLAAVMSKEHALFLWPAILLIDIWPRPRSLPLRRWLNEVLIPSHIGLILAASIFFFLRVSVFGGSYVLEGWRLRVWEHPLGHASLIEHVLTPFRLAWLTLSLLAWPPLLCPIWSYPALSPPSRLAPDVIGGIGLVLATLTFAFFCWRRRLIIGAVAGGMLLLFLIPLQGLPVARWMFAERWLYLPSVPVALLVAAGLSRLRAPGLIAGLTAAVILLPASWSYSGAFSDNREMNRQVTLRQPKNYQGRKNYAMALVAGGEYQAALQAADEILEDFAEEFRRHGEPIEPYRVRISAHLELGDGRQALAALERHDEINKDVPSPSLITVRERAEELIRQEEQAKSRPAPAPETAAASSL